MHWVLISRCQVHLIVLRAFSQWCNHARYQIWLNHRILPLFLYIEQKKYYYFFVNAPKSSKKQLEFTGTMIRVVGTDSGLIIEYRIRPVLIVPIFGPVCQLVEWFHIISGQCTRLNLIIFNMLRGKHSVSTTHNTWTLNIIFKYMFVALWILVTITTGQSTFEYGRVLWRNMGCWFGLGKLRRETCIRQTSAFTAWRQLPFTRAQ